jgi:Fe(II)/alpha-ketoglutarate-dependent arginine beta-hydroxylase
VPVATYRLSQLECDAVDALLASLLPRYESAGSPEFCAAARRLAYARLPAGLTAFLDGFQRDDGAPAVAVSGFTVDEGRLGPTPAHWNTRVGDMTARREELFFVLLGSVLGEPFGWTTLQGGRLIQNVVPIRGQEQEQSGHGSAAVLAWHTEDAFHPYRCDYLGLMGLRNEQRIPTTYAVLDAGVLTAIERRTLHEPRFLMRPDDEHLNQRERDGPAPSAADRAVLRHLQEPVSVAVLFGDPRRPYLRIDPVFMSAVPGDAQAVAALDTLVRRLDGALDGFVIEPGTVCFFDNYRVVHGRRAFRPRYDGRDRWLKKILLTRDARKSRALRVEVEVPVLVPAPVDARQETIAG